MNDKRNKPYMGSMISTSYKHKTIFLLLLTCVLYFFANFFAVKSDEYIRNKQEKRNIYRGDTQGRFHLIQHMFKQGNPDIIFIGNSITILHVNTAFFHQSAIKSFNYATTSYFIGQYPAMISNAIKLNPKVIAISILLPDFYMPSDYYYEHYNKLDDIAFKNLHLLANHLTIKETRMFMHYLWSYFKGCQYFFRQGYLISRYISAINTKYQGFRFLRALIPFHRKEFPPKLVFNCNFNDKGYHTTHCFNGDFVLVKKKIKLNDYRKIAYLDNKNLNNYLISVFNDFFDRIKRAGVQPLLVLIPTFERFIVDKSLLKNSIHADIIDLSDIPFAGNNFADRVHFNMQGREVYSLALANKVKPLLV